jgi:two-component system sensor histidine kinase VicK
MVQQIAEFLGEEVVAPATSRIPQMLGLLETTSRDSVAMIRELINLEFLVSTNSNLERDRVDVGAVLRVPRDQLQTGQRANPVPPPFAPPGLLQPVWRVRLREKILPRAP